MDLVIRGRRVVTPAGERPASITIERGRIERVGEHADPTGGAARVIDAGDLLVMPGLVDTHVHINEPGRTEWEGFATATRAAAAGGITTLVDMPLNSIPATTNVAALEEKRAAARGQCWVDVGFWGGVVPGNDKDIAPLAEAGVFGFKCFMVPSGVPEFAHVEEADLRRALPEIASTGLPLLVHAESPRVIECSASALADPAHRSSYARYLASRPAAAEAEAIELVARLTCQTVAPGFSPASAAEAVVAPGFSPASGARIHIVHLSSATAVEAVRRARQLGVRMTAETCPHYLYFAAEHVPDGATTFKCAPPIRPASEREALWSALRDGTIDLVASDHSPSPPSLKCLEIGDFARAWGGIASLQVALAAVWTSGAARGCRPSDLARWLSASPAELAGLARRKGSLVGGADADVVIWDPDAEFVVEAAALHHRHLVTPYAGERLRGRVVTTILGGQVVYDRGVLSERASGILLERTPRE